MRTGVEFTVSAEQRRQLEATAEDGNDLQQRLARLDRNASPSSYPGATVNSACIRFAK